MAVVEDNSLEFALQETAKGFSRNGKSINLKPEPVAAFLNGKDVLAVLPTGFGKSAIFQLLVNVKEYTSKDSACILVICLLRSLTEEDRDSRSKIGLTANSVPEASLGDVRGNFNCYSRQSFRVLFPFLWSFL